MNRVFSLDVVRGMAMAMVLIGHLSVRGFPMYLPEPLASFQRMSWVSMEVFFALSGFLVSSLLFKEYSQTGKINFFRFLARRGLKIYPTYYVVVLCSAAFYLTRGSFEWGRCLRSVFFLANYEKSFWPHFWTLSLEEHFYLSFSFLLMLSLKSARSNFRLLGLVGILLPLSAFAVRNYLLWDAEYASYYRHLNPTHLRWSAVILGAWLGYFHVFHRETLIRMYRKRAVFVRVAVGVIFFLLSLSPLRTAWVARFGLDLSAIAGVCVCWIALGDAEAFAVREKWLRVFRFLGKYSYGIYMFHYPFRVLQMYSEQHYLGGPVHPILNIATYFLVSIGGGYCLTRLVELPVLAWRDRHVPSHSSAKEVPEIEPQRLAA
ncbi:MAG: acyltransferase [Bdellovibrionales bacterium]|nr:acyltransferase [Bdellovibrionales bacterium]